MAPSHTGVCGVCRTPPLPGFAPDTGEFAPELRANPGPQWQNARLSDNWHALERAVGPARMPRAVIGRPRAPGRPRPVRAVEHGRGFYGVVMPTGEPGVVFKLTSDPAEARFAAAVLAERDPPPGVVRYHALARVAGSRHGRPVWALWREEAHAIGGMRAGAFRREVETFHCLGSLAHDAWKCLFERNRLSLRDDALAWARHWSGRLPGPATASARQAGQTFARAVGASPPPPRLGYALAACRALAERMARARPSALVGGAILWALDRGMLLSDVHRDNVGMAARGGARRHLITDPGIVLWLREEPAPAADDVGTGPVVWRP